MPVELTQQMLEDLRSLETLHTNLAGEIAKAKSAGVDTSELEDRLGQMESLRQGLLKVYGGTSKRRKVG